MTPEQQAARDRKVADLEATLTGAGFRLEATGAGDEPGSDWAAYTRGTGDEPDFLGNVSITVGTCDLDGVRLPGKVEIDIHAGQDPRITTSLTGWRGDANLTSLRAYTAAIDVAVAILKEFEV